MEMRLAQVQKDTFGVRAILPRPEGRGLTRNRIKPPKAADSNPQAAQTRRTSPPSLPTLRSCKKQGWSKRQPSWPATGMAYCDCCAVTHLDAVRYSPKASAA